MRLEDRLERVILLLIVGRSLAQYRVLEKLGESGMGVVYKAEDTRLGRQVALKLLLASLAGDPDSLSRLQREAQILASLNHPNISAIYGLEESEGLRFLWPDIVCREFGERVRFALLKRSASQAISAPLFLTPIASSTPC
jgi:serine/threonine protein kinase